MSEYFTAVVVPCLNEEASLASTCKSLGFGCGERVPHNSAIVIVDNGSEDSTVGISKDIQSACADGTVIISAEAERGYVPPRRHGNVIAINAAAARGISKENLL